MVHWGFEPAHRSDAERVVSPSPRRSVSPSARYIASTCITLISEPPMSIPLRKGPVMLIVMDGWGLRESAEHNAVKMAKTPVYDRLSKEYPFNTLRTCGTDVGLPKGTM